MQKQCPTCGSEYKRLAMHWNRSECQYHSFSGRQWEQLQGLLMGDADLHGLSDTNSHFRVRMTNKPFIEYLDSQWGILSKGAYQARSASKQYATAVQNQKRGVEGFDTVNKDEYSALYGIRTCSHPALNDFKEWYSEGEKRFPTDLTLTPEVCRMWYVCDGWLAEESNANYRAMFKVSNEVDRKEYLIELFDEAGFEVGFSRQAIQVPHVETVKLLDWMGSPPPGFAYKWGM